MDSELKGASAQKTMNRMGRNRGDKYVGAEDRQISRVKAYTRINLQHYSYCTTHTFDIQEILKIKNLAGQKQVQNVKRTLLISFFN